jgi:hypothetical protein
VDAAGVERSLPAPAEQLLPSRTPNASNRRRLTSVKPSPVRSTGSTRSIWATAPSCVRSWGTQSRAAPSERAGSPSIVSWRASTKPPLWAGTRGMTFTTPATEPGP